MANFSASIFPRLFLEKRFPFLGILRKCVISRRGKTAAYSPMFIPFPGERFSHRKAGSSSSEIDRSQRQLTENYRANYGRIKLSGSPTNRLIPVVGRLKAVPGFSSEGISSKHRSVPAGTVSAFCSVEILRSRIYFRCKVPSK